MSFRRCYLLPLLMGTLPVYVPAATTPVDTRPNVLFIAFDDLNDWIRPLDPTSPILMPNLERLARRGVLFRRAYCAAP